VVWRQKPLPFEQQIEWVFSTTCSGQKKTRIQYNGQQKKARSRQRGNGTEKKSPASTVSGRVPADFSRRTLLSLLCLILLGSAVYLNTLHNQFVFDDLPLIRDNPSISNLARVPSYLFSGIDNAPYRPLRWMSYAIDYQFSGLKPVAYHVSNIAYHLLTVITIYFTIVALTGSGAAAFIAACLFAVHPVHTDSVTYISGRRDILSTLFYILGFFLFLQARQKNRPRLLIFALASYLLAIGSKEMAVTLPAMFFFYDLINNLSAEGPRLRRCAAGLKKIVSRYKLFYLCFFIPAVLFTGYKVLIKSPSNKIGFYGGELYIQLLTLAKILVYYIKLLLYPVTLIADYSFNSFPLSTSFFEPATLVSILLLCLIALVTARLLFTDAVMAFAVIWFFVTLLPVCHLFPHHELLAEHYLYLPSFGFVLLVSLLLVRAAANPRWKYPVYTFLALIIVLFSLRTFDRNYDWKNSFTLWSKTVETVPSCVRAINNLGIEYYNRKDYQTAKSLYQKAIQLQPAYEKAYYNLGNIYKEEKDYERALAMYEKTAELNPTNNKNFNNLGNAYAIQKKFPEAIKAYRRALEINPNYAEAYNNLGNVYRSLQEYDQAIAHYEKALTLHRGYIDAYYNLADTYSSLKQDEQSVKVLFRAMEANWFLPATYYRLGVAYENNAQYDKAIAAYENALQADPGYAEARLNLASLYMGRMKDTEKALHHLRTALANAPRHPQAERIKEAIRALEMKKPG
jgi:tetratricopeptide (TPR) repeat protein